LTKLSKSARLRNAGGMIDGAQRLRLDDLRLRPEGDQRVL